jgi:hypothetical protein
MPWFARSLAFHAALGGRRRRCLSVRYSALVVAGRRQEQTLLVHALTQTWPQLPQLFLSLVVFTSQPLAAILSQFERIVRINGLVDITARYQTLPATPTVA